MTLRVVTDEQWPDKPCIVLSLDKDGTLTIDQGTLPTTEAKAIIATAFVAFCAPPSVTDGLSLYALLQFKLVGDKKRLGWALGMLGEVFWLAYAIVFRQYGFVIGAFIYGGIYLRNYLKWRPTPQS